MDKNFDPWYLDRENYCLVLKGNGYWVPLKEIHNSAQMLDWIFQIKTKTWATPEVMFGLLTALDSLLCPQSLYCSWGVNKTVKNPREIATRRQYG